MRHRILLPAELGPHFSVRDATRSGVGRTRLAARDLARPFDGVRALQHPEDFAQQVACFALRMRPGQVLAGRTAARLWGLPLPMRWTLDEAIDVAVATGTSPPRTRGVRGRKLAGARLGTLMVDGLPVLDPIATVFVCAAELTPHQTAVMVEALIATARNYPGIRPTAHLSRAR